VDGIAMAMAMEDWTVFLKVERKRVEQCRYTIIYADSNSIELGICYYLECNPFGSFRN